MSDGLITRTNRKGAVVSIILVSAQFVATVLGVLIISNDWSRIPEAFGVGGVALFFGLTLMFAPPIRRESVDIEFLHRVDDEIEKRRIQRRNMASP